MKYLVAYNSSELNVPPLINERPSSLDSLRVIILKDQWAIFKVDSATRKEVESYYKKSKAANRELDTMAYIEGKLAEIILYLVSGRRWKMETMGLTLE